MFAGADLAPAAFVLLLPQMKGFRDKDALLRKWEVPRDSRRGAGWFGRREASLSSSWPSCSAPWIFSLGQNVSQQAKSSATPVWAPHALGG